MSVEVFALPRMGETMESGRVVAWTKQPGESFLRGETIVEIETDKTTVEVPALSDGRLTEIIAAEGTDVDVGAPLCRFEGRAAAAVEALDDSPSETPHETAPLSPVDALRVLVLPRMGETMESGRVGSWMKKPGERFTRGETLVEIESDKTTVELPALEDGELVEILAEAGSETEVGAPLCRFRGNAAAPAIPASAAPEAPASAAIPTPPRPPQPAARPEGARLRATPKARSLARRNGVVLEDVVGSGRRGRIEIADIMVGTLPNGAGLLATPRFLDLPDGQLAFREWLPATGAARGTALLLHGFAGDAQTWSAFARLLTAGGLRVLAPDLPAHGATTIDAEVPDTMTEAVAALIGAETSGEIELVGHSMGALVATRIAARPELRTRRLTLIAPAGMGAEIDGLFVAGMARVASAGGLAHLLRRIAVRPPVLSEAQLGDMAASLGAKGRLVALAASLAADGIQLQDLIVRLAALTIPVRLVWGLEDRIVPWTQVRSAPSQVAIHLLADAGHMPHWDKPKEIAALFA